MNARKSENYLAISHSFSDSKSVEISWAEIYRGRLLLGPNLFSKILDSMSVNKGNNKITELRTILQRESQNS